MKIILCLNQDIHSVTALNLLFPHLKNHQVKIILSQKVGKVDNLPLELQNLRQFEQGDLLSLFQKIDESKINNFEQSKKFFTFKQIAQFFQSEISFYGNINSEIALNDFKEFAPDLIISIRFGQIFREQIISIPKHGIINLHSGILPNFRGIMPSFWAILNGESQIGTTLHYIENTGIDTGSIIGFSYFTPNKNLSLVFNINKIYEGGCNLLVDNLDKILSGSKINSLQQSNLEGKYFSYPQDADINRFLDIAPLTKEEDMAWMLERWGSKN